MTLEKIGALHPPSFPLPLPPRDFTRGGVQPPPPPPPRIHNKAEVCLAASSAVSPSHSCIGEGEAPPGRACLEVPGWALMWSCGVWGVGGGGGGGGGGGPGVRSPGVQYQLLSGLGSLWREVFMVSRYSCCDTASTDARISSSSQSLRPKAVGDICCMMARHSNAG